ncbi:MAG TPA: gamma-glutamyltransferase, partial [Acidimicrobiales bacterium]|nr:gamma-glutamyltransferase [Acidimicrobiales bacterium]
RPAVLYDGADGRALLDSDRLSAAVARIRPDRAAVDPEEDRPAPSPGGGTAEGDTTHLCAADADGLGVSLTQSNALDFGSHLVAGSTGVFLHNRGVGFSLVEGHPAELTPGRRPPHTLSPMVAVAPDGAPVHLLGAMGGDAQPQVLLQLVARLLRCGQDPATALAAARFSLDAPAAGPFRLWWGERQVNLEGHAPPEWAPGLAARGHRVRSISAFDPVAVGCAQVIRIDGTPDGQGWSFTGAADPRSPDGGTAVR